MAKLYYESSAIRNDSAQDSLQHWKYIRREKVGDKWKYFYKDDGNGVNTNSRTTVSTTKDGKTIKTTVKDRKGLLSKNYEISTGRSVSTTHERGAIERAYDNAKSKINNAVTKKKASKINRMTMEEWDKKNPLPKETDSSKAAAKKKPVTGNQVAKKIVDDARNKASQEVRTKVGKKIVDDAISKDKKAEQETRAAQARIAQIRANRAAEERKQKEADAKEAAAEKERQHKENILKSMSDRKNAKLNEKKAIYEEAKAKRDAEAEGMRKAAKEFANRFLENRKEEAERKRREMRKRRGIQ
jgi:hypothetical protein